METTVFTIVIALAAYAIGLLVYTYWQATRDRFYEGREERRRNRYFKSAGQFVPKKRQASPDNSEPIDHEGA